MSQLLLLVMETVLEGYFGIVIGVVGPLVMIFLSFLQVPLMPLRFAIGSTFAGDQQILGAIGYQLVLIIGLVLIQIFYMPGRWGVMPQITREPAIHLEVEQLSVTIKRKRFSIICHFHWCHQTFTALSAQMERVNRFC